MTEQMYTIEFESVSAQRYPHLYDWRTERARKDITPAEMEGVEWHKARRTDNEASIRSQHTGLKQLIAEGELIRNVKVFKTTITETETEVDW